MNRGLAAAGVAFAIAAVWAPASLDAQTRRSTPTPPRPPAASAVRTEAAKVNCPQVLGDGVRTKRQYCDVLIGRDPAGGILVALPPHAGPVTLTFDLHNRHTYSADLVKAKKAFSRYTARIGVMSMNTDLLTRAIISSEFSTESDLFDRISGGSGPGGLKAVAPTGIEAIEVVIPEAHQAVSILGERLSVVRVEDVDTFTATGRPIALISNVRIEYVPAPAPPTPKPAPAGKR